MNNDVVWRAGVLTAAVALSALIPACADPPSRPWTVPGTTAVSSLNDLQFSDDPIVPSRQVMLRTSNADFDNWGPIMIYPVVRSPQGKLYYGFIRHYAGGSISENWISYTFPEDFRAGASVQEDELNWSFGDGLVDSLIDNSGTLPKGTYQVKWVVNNKLVDAYDSFTYPGFKG